MVLAERLAYHLQGNVRWRITGGNPVGSASDGSPIVIDLFCGAGGLSDGLSQAGFKPIVGIDFDRHAIATYKANHPESLALHRDITTITAEELIAAAGGKEVDLI